MSAVVESLSPFGKWDVWHALEAIYAYDRGATDSGVHDEQLRQWCVVEIDGLTEDEFRRGISQFCRDAYLTDDGLASGYGMEDAANFFRWVFDGDFRLWH